MTDPIKAVLVNVDGVERWCERDMRACTTAAGKPIGEAVYAYCDVVCGVRYAPGVCREIREGLVRVECVEVKA